MAGGGRGSGRQPVRGRGGWLVSAGLADGLAGRPGRGGELAGRADPDPVVGHRRDPLRPAPLAADARGSLGAVEPWETSFVDLPGAQGLLAQVDALTARIRDYVAHGTTNARPFTWTATAEEILAKVAWVQTNVQQLAADNAK
jgi:hypothetical protein